ncbi:MAG: ribose 5-phosphate isomerase B [Clostridiales bacterium]|nr:ribose 5-phosphate isomerase B [Clostridiales bacterium]
MTVIGSDHAGYPLKEKIREYFEENNIPYIDCGVFSEDSADYALIAESACAKIISGEADNGVLCCGTGIGISIAANKVNGIRAACCSDYYSAKLTRLHNNANVLCMGARVIGWGHALELVNVFLNTEFEGGRHQRRIDQISDIEKRQ